jgi:hypothetical protein
VTSPTTGSAPLALSRARADLADLLTSVRTDAEARGDLSLLWATDALQRIHDLFPDADTLANRGSPAHLARMAIHNAIIDASVEHELRLRSAAEDADGGHRAPVPAVQITG